MLNTAVKWLRAVNQFISASKKHINAHETQRNFDKKAKKHFNESSEDESLGFQKKRSNEFSICLELITQLNHGLEVLRCCWQFGCCNS